MDGSRVLSIGVFSEKTLICHVNNGGDQKLCTRHIEVVPIS
jgi:hypothetical protein